MSGARQLKDIIMFLSELVGKAHGKEINFMGFTQANIIISLNVQANWDFLKQGFPDLGTCTRKGTFANLKGYS